MKKKVFLQCIQPTLKQKQPEERVRQETSCTVVKPRLDRKRISELPTFTSAPPNWAHECHTSLNIGVSTETWSLR